MRSTRLGYDMDPLLLQVLGVAAVTPLPSLLFFFGIFWASRSRCQGIEATASLISQPMPDGSRSGSLRSTFIAPW